MRVRLRNKEIERVSSLHPEITQEVLPLITKDTKVPTDTKLFYITIGLLSGDIILQLVQLALKLL